MNRISLWVGILLVSALVLCSSAAAYNITDSSVTNTNVYAGSSVSTFGPEDTYDSLSCTAEGVTFDSGVYIRPISFTSSVSNSVDVLFSTLTQGAMVTVSDGVAVETPYKWSFGDGKSADTYLPQVSHTYPSGEYTASVNVYNYLNTGGVSDSVQLEILYGGYDTYSSGFISILSLIIVAALVGAVVLLLLFIRGGGDVGILIPFAAGLLGLIIVFMIVATIAGSFDEITMGLLSGGV